MTHRRLACFVALTLGAACNSGGGAGGYYFYTDGGSPRPVEGGGNNGNGCLGECALYAELRSCAPGGSCTYDAGGESVRYFCYGNGVRARVMGDPNGGVRGVYYRNGSECFAYDLMARGNAPKLTYHLTHSARDLALTYSPDGKTVAVDCGGRLSSLRLDDPKCKETLSVLQGPLAMGEQCSAGACDVP